MPAVTLLGLNEAAEHHGDILEQCGQFFDQQQLSIFVSETLPLEQAADAHRPTEAGGMSGKVVLKVQHTDGEEDA